MGRFQKKLMNSVFAKSIKDIEAFTQRCSILTKTQKSIVDHKTIYCISPYKTGTTFLSASFSKEISQHEPMQYLSLQQLDKNFNTFLIKRLNTLNLKLECSGFFSAYMDELASHPLAKDFEYIVVARSPSAWVNSVVNYWSKLEYLKNDYINTYFWRGKVGVDLFDFKNKTETEKQEIVDQLIDFYFEFTNNTKKLNNVTYIYLRDLEGYINVLAEKIGETPEIKHRRKNKNDSKFYLYKNEQLDEKYHTLIKELQKLNPVN